MDKHYYFPKYLDEPFRIILLTIDECFAFGIPFAFGFLFNFVLTGFFLGIITLFLWRFLKGNAKYRRFSALSYWYVPSMTHLRHIPPSYWREYLG